MEEKSILPAKLRMKLFQAVLEFMGRCGVDEATICGSLETAFADYRDRRKNARPRSKDALYIKTQNLPAQLLRVWHRDSRFIDQEARPRPLALTGGRNSLRSLVAKIDPAIDPDAALRSMKKAGLIRRMPNGRYLPTSESAIVDQLHPLLVEHVTRLVSRLISTVGRNTDPSGKSLSLIDRHAYTIDLDSAERKAFSEFTRSRGMAYLEAIDDWLEQRRVSRASPSVSKRKTSKGIAAGVYLFAYLGDDEGIDSMHAPVLISSKPRVKNEVAPCSVTTKRSTPARAARA